MSMRVPSFYGLWEVAMAAVADAFAGTKTSTVFNVAKYRTAVFLLHKAVGTTGVSTITMEACSAADGSNATAIAFNYRKATTLDAFGAYTAATASGFSTTAGSNQLYEITVDTDVLGALGYQYLRLKAVETADDPVLGGVIAYLTDPRYDQVTQATALT